MTRIRDSFVAKMSSAGVPPDVTLKWPVDGVSLESPVRVVTVTVEIGFDQDTFAALTRIIVMVSPICIPLGDPVANIDIKKVC